MGGATDATNVFDTSTLAAAVITPLGACRPRFTPISAHLQQHKAFGCCLRAGCSTHAKMLYALHGVS